MSRYIMSRLYDPDNEMMFVTPADNTLLCKTLALCCSLWYPFQPVTLLAWTHALTPHLTSCLITRLHFLLRI